MSREEEEAKALQEWKDWFKWKDGGYLYQTLYNVFGAFSSSCKCLYEKD